MIYFLIRFVTGGGPSVDKLMPGDQILTINGEDVARFTFYPIRHFLFVT